MKNRIHLLTTLLLISSVTVAMFGGYIKYGILKPLGIDREENIVAMSFVYMTDDALQFMAQMKREMLANTDTNPTDEATVQPTVATTVATTVTTTEVPATQTGTDGTEQSVMETQLTTAPPTEASTEPVEPVEDSWFDDALFIGDSRMHALRAYNRMGEATYFTRVGLNIYSVFKAWESDRTFSEWTLEKLLQERTFGKVIINLGLNGCQYEHEFIRAGFEDLIALIRQYQPDAKIIFMSIMMVSESYSKTETYFSLENLQAINDILASFADDETIFYMDSNAWIVDENGYLPKGVTNDGAHLLGKYYDQWADWIRLQCGAYPFD